MPSACMLQDGLEVKQKDKEMKRVLGLFELAAFGISAIIGGGIFVVTGLQAKTNAGWVLGDEAPDLKHPPVLHLELPVNLGG